MTWYWRGFLMRVQRDHWRKITANASVEIDVQTKHNKQYLIILCGRRSKTIKYFISTMQTVVRNIGHGMLSYFRYISKNILQIIIAFRV